MKANKHFYYFQPNRKNEKNTELHTNSKQIII